MNGRQAERWIAFRALCRVVGGQDDSALMGCLERDLLSPLCQVAQSEDLLPALAVRCAEKNASSEVLGEGTADLLTRALIDNSKRNMQISAQAIKISRQLNRAGISPLFLKGTAFLLVPMTHNIGFRKQVDIDLIVRPDELEAAAEVFLADGYNFCEFAGGLVPIPVESGDGVFSKLRRDAHHHLLPLVKPGYAATVELHRHYLPTRFQRNNALALLFDGARHIDSRGVSFQVPSTECHLIHLVLGKFVHDGHVLRRSFPIREACDFADLLLASGSDIDHGLLVSQCGSSFSLFSALVAELLGLRLKHTRVEPIDVSRYVLVMQKRYEYPRAAKLFYAYARIVHLTQTLVHNPAKLRTYVSRKLS